MSLSTSSSRTAVEHLYRVESFTDSALAHLDVDELLIELLDRARELLQVDTAAVLLLDASSRYLVARAARGLEEEVRQGSRIPLGKGFAGRIAATRQPVVIEDIDHSNVLNPVLRQKRVRSLLGVPLLVAGTVTGVIHVGTLSPRTFTDQDVDLLQVVADRAALAIRVSQSRVDLAAATALQRSLVPAKLPDVVGYEFAARYVSGQGGAVGGDWYDVFVLPSGSVGVAVGDVAGAGFAAAGVMGRLRSALRAYALEHQGPGQVLTKLAWNVRHFEPGTMATVLYAVLEPQAQRLQLSVAGHPVPVLALPEQPATLLDLPIDVPMGVPAPRTRRTTTIELPPGALLCLYTDGLVERRDSTLDAGLERLRAAVATGPVEAVCADVMNAQVGNDLPSDDIVLLAARRSPDTGPDTAW